MKIKDPLQVEITDQIQEWASRKYGAPHLPEFFLSEFHDHHQASGKKFADAEQAFKNWITWSAPGGKYYRADVWEDRLRRAKRKAYSERSSLPLFKVAGQYVNDKGRPTAEPPIAAKSSADVARKFLEQAKLKARGAA